MLGAPSSLCLVHCMHKVSHVGFLSLARPLCSWFSHSRSAQWLVAVSNTPAVAFRVIALRCQYSHSHSLRTAGCSSASRTRAPCNRPLLSVLALALALAPAAALRATNRRCQFSHSHSRSARLLVLVLSQPRSARLLVCSPRLSLRSRLGSLGNGYMQYERLTPTASRPPL